MTDRSGRNEPISGGTGSFGNAIVPIVLKAGHVVTVYSRDEQKQEQMRGSKEAAPAGGPSSLHYASSVQATACFRFLRQPSKPNALRPVAKSGRAAGSGVALGARAKTPAAPPLSQTTATANGQCGTARNRSPTACPARARGMADRR
jgi:hypothetical protein